MATETRCTPKHLTLRSGRMSENIRRPGEVSKPPPGLAATPTLEGALAVGKDSESPANGVDEGLRAGLREIVDEWAHGPNRFQSGISRRAVVNVLRDLLDGDIADKGMTPVTYWTVRCVTCRRDAFEGHDHSAWFEQDGAASEAEMCGYELVDGSWYCEEHAPDDEAGDPR